MACHFVRWMWAAALPAILCSEPGRACAQGWSYTRIADTSALVPGSTMPFLLFELPSIRDGTVGFAGFATTGSTGPAGVYTGSGGALTVVADRQTPSPAGGTFVGFGLLTNAWPSLHAGGVAFRAGDGIEGGIFHKTGGVIAPVATTQTPIPNGGGGTFGGTGNPSLENGRVVFTGGHAPVGPQRGVYSWEDGALSVIADITTPIPGGSGTFTSIGEASLDGGQILFQGAGASGYQGLFVADQAGALSRLYDTSTPVPGGGTFTGLSQSAFSDGRVAFRGFGPGAEGVYTDVSGSLQVLANPNTPAPGFPGQTFTGFGTVAIDSGVVAFSAIAGGGPTGVWSTHTGTLAKVLAEGDALDGRIVAECGIGGQSLDGDSLAIGVWFTNGSRGIYRATIPAPGAVAMFAIAGVWAARRRRR